MNKKVKEIINKSDIILIVQDARILFKNKEIEEYCKRKGKKIIYVLNKADLVESEDLLQLYGDVYVSSRTRKGLRALRRKIKEIAKEINKDKIIIGVVGFPNTGKSSLINALRGKHVAATAPKPGKTKGPQLVKLSNRFYLLDSPGVFDIKDKELLAILGSYSPEKLENPIKAALKLVDLIKDDVKEQFGVNGKTSEEILNNLAKKWNLNLEESARRLLHRWVSGKIKVSYPIELDYKEENGEKKKEEKIF